MARRVSRAVSARLKLKTTQPRDATGKSGADAAVETAAVAADEPALPPGAVLLWQRSSSSEC